MKHFKISNFINLVIEDSCNLIISLDIGLPLFIEVMSGQKLQIAFMKPNYIHDDTYIYAKSVLIRFTNGLNSAP